MLALAVWARQSRAAEDRPPNIVLILADDLGYGDLGCYGQQVIDTPHLDRMTAEGLRFTQFYAGSTVCAPSRCVLMTGLHTGHCRIRGNGGGRTGGALQNDDVTVADVLKKAGYATAICGKWGLGEPGRGQQGIPNRQGFDYFFGYLNHTHAHNYYPEYLWRNTDRVPLPNVVTHPRPNSPGGYATEKIAYSHDLVTNAAIDFVRRNHDKPFFLFWAATIPHANNEARAATGDGQEVPGYGRYADKDWPNPDKGQAAMISRLDDDVGRLFDTLRELGIDDETLVLLTSDNGPHHEGGQDTERFDPNGPLRGFKRDLYEGGVRVPLLARWPGVVPAGEVSDHISYFGDVFATLSEVAGQQPPEGLDSISLLPTLRGKPDEQRQHEYLYWEFYEQGSKQAVRWQDWKAVRRPILTGQTELYNLEADLGESTDVAADNLDIVRRLEEMMDAARVSDPNWQVPSQPQTSVRPDARAD